MTNKTFTDKILDRIESMAVNDTITLNVGAQRIASARSIICKTNGYYTTRAQGSKLLVTKLQKPKVTNREYVERICAMCKEKDGAWMNVHLDGMKIHTFRNLLPSEEYETYLEEGDLFMRKRPGLDYYGMIHQQLHGMNEGETRLVDMLDRPYAIFRATLTSRSRDRGKYKTTMAIDGFCRVTRMGTMTDEKFYDYLFYLMMTQHDFDIIPHKTGATIAKRIANKLGVNITFTHNHIRVHNVIERIKALNVGSGADFIKSEAEEVQKFLLEHPGKYAVDENEVYRVY